MGFLKFLSSLKLAVFLIISLAVIAAVGTIYEARFDAQVAQKVVYRSFYMYIVMGLLITNLTAVMVNRWPWKKRHTAFILAHIGIIIMLMGALITQHFGLDGNLAFGIGESNRFVSIDGTELSVYASLDGSSLTPLYNQPVDFFLDPPKKKPLSIGVGKDSLNIIDYEHYALRQSEIVASDKKTDGAALRLQLQNDRVNMSQWLIQEPGKKSTLTNLGPAQIILTKEPFTYTKGNVLVFNPGTTSWRYQVYTARQGGLTSQGQLREGDTIPLGWMGLKMTALRVLPQAREVVSYLKKEKPSPLTRSAVKIRYQNEEHWVGLNTVLKLYGDNSMLYLTYSNRRVDLGFPITLDKFEVGHYQGTLRASSYQSDVSIPGLGQKHISMNEPLKYKGYTFYQASFEQDEMGRPITSILSVNRDPGRPFKYLGSLMIVLGIVMLFYFKKLGRSQPGAPR